LDAERAARIARPFERSSRPARRIAADMPADDRIPIEMVSAAGQQSA
jgi:hypothetical protein